MEEIEKIREMFKFLTQKMTTIENKIEKSFKESKKLREEN